MRSPPASRLDDRRAVPRVQQEKTLLRIVTCGGVGVGTSTLIGRLLFEAGALFGDRVTAPAEDSSRSGTRGGDLDFALLLDGVSSERRQGINIDVVHRFFSSRTRRFVVADVPGHPQFTRGLLTAASTADVAVALVDARNGVLTQTRRHTYLLALLGIRHVALAVNKMDLVDYSRDRFHRIAEEYKAFGARVGTLDVTPIPVAAIEGANVVVRNALTPWYDGPTLMEYLDRVVVDGQPESGGLRLPVQCVIGPDADFRGVAGFIVGGGVRVGDEICVLPSGHRSSVARLLVGDADVEAARTGQSITMLFSEPVDVCRGDVIASAHACPAVADRFESTIVWMHAQPMFHGRSYLAKLGTRTVSATVATIHHAIDVDTLERLPAKSLELNGIGVCEVQLGEPVVFEPYRESRDLGGFILIDRVSSATVGAGLIQSAVRGASDVHRQVLDIDRNARASLKAHQPCVVWFTGLSGAGKSTIANLLEKRLHALGAHTYLLDGDNVRQGLNRDLGFTDADRVESIRRVAEVTNLMADAGLIVLASFISPFRAERVMARELVAPVDFVEVHVDVPLAVAEARDPKGLYKAARAGELRDFTGVDSPYEPPDHPDVRIDTVSTDAEAAVDLLLDTLRRLHVIRSTW